MSDQDYERAQKAVTFIVDEVGSGEYAVSALFEELAGEFAAVRDLERRAIVDALVAQYGASCRITGGVFSGTAFLRAIESIERGEHSS